jgi:hypothetical protein
MVASFHPRAKPINGLTIEQPWQSDCDRTLFPPPHPTILRDHFQASVAKWMKAASEEYDEDDSFDKDEIAELTEISDDRCQVADFDHMLGGAHI